jgi:asparagine synthase (glutamine-hydrolysing)
MCGITGIFAFNLVGKFNKIHVTQATIALEKRGPDFQDIYIDEWVGLGHRRLSIIDTSEISNQPMWDEQKRYCIVFNGEIFNYRELRKELADAGTPFFSNGDTEVLLKLYIRYKEKCLEKLNGFFSFCIYDKQEQSFFLARDRYGIKPLLYCFDEDKFIFASEMKSVVQYGIDKAINYNALYTYLQLNYIPAPASIFSSVQKLLPGHFIKVKRQHIDVERYYAIPYSKENTYRKELTYEDAQKKLRTLLEESVQRRLVSDVPLGCFLSGGIDSSIIAGLAARHKPDLHTFSIGFKDEKFFDETHYASLVSKHFKTDHTIFSLTNHDLYSSVQGILNYIDEPFADSSAIAVHILSKETRKYATVALSGDGADEMFAGYNKHAAHLKAIQQGWKEKMVSSLLPLWKIMPKSRSTPFGNVARQLTRFGEGAQLSGKERYWRWAGFLKEKEALSLLHPEKQALAIDQYSFSKSLLLSTLPNQETMNDVLLTDMNLVLANDMLTKVDLMSMSTSLEVRVPFLDYNVVNFAFSLPDDFKITGKIRKRILQDAFRDFLPSELYNRPKKGFEVPLLKWLRHEMKDMIEKDLLSKDFISSQGVFNIEEVEKLKGKLFSPDPGDSHATVWALLVFQHWWKKFGR